MAVKGKHKSRIAITLAAYALAGLVTTLAIAWVQPFAGPVRNLVATVKGREQELFSTRTGDRYVRFGKVFDASVAASLAEESRSAKYSDLGRRAFHLFGGPFDEWIADFRGFPFRCT